MSELPDNHKEIKHFTQRSLALSMIWKKAHLCDAVRLGGDDVRVSEGVQQRCFPVVEMPQYRYNRIHIFCIIFSYDIRGENLKCCCLVVKLSRQLRKVFIWNDYVVDRLKLKPNINELTKYLSSCSQANNSQ